jgi:hypothetical protein
MTKQCSKCKRVLEVDQFVKATRYNDGLYPSCKQCRNKACAESLKNNPMCSRCGKVPHTEKHSYCYDCQREAKGQSKECQREYNGKWIRDRGGMWRYLVSKGDRLEALR